MARAAADRYFAALASDLPFDNAPGDVDLLTAASDIAAVMEANARHEHTDHGVDSSLRAGYLLGVEIGKRIAGGAR